MGYRHQCRTLFRYQIGIFDSQVLEPSFLIEAQNLLPPQKSCVYSALLCFLFWFGSTLPPQFMVGPAKDMRQNTPIMDRMYLYAYLPLSVNDPFAPVVSVQTIFWRSPPFPPLFPAWTGAWKLGKHITRGALAWDTYLAIISLARGFVRTILAKGGKLKLALIGVFYSQKERTRLFYYLKK